MELEVILKGEYYGVVYAIRCLVNGKFYIGQHAGYEFEKKRIKNHLYHARKGLDKCVKLDRAIRKHGERNFVYGIVDFTNSKEELNDLECYYIHTFDSVINGYNIRPGGGSHGYLTDEHKRKIGDANRGENNWMFGRTGSSHHNYGKRPSEETRQKMRNARLGKPSVRGDYKLPPESIAKISASLIGRRRDQELMKRIGEKNRGRRYPEKGKGRKFSNEHRAKIAAAHCGKRKRYDDEFVKNVIELYSQGYSALQIAEKFTVSTTPVKNVLKRNNIQRRKGGRRSRKS